MRLPVLSIQSSCRPGYQSYGMSLDHEIAKANGKHRDITTCKIEEPQRKYRLGTISNRLLEALTSLTGHKHRP